MGVIRVFAAAQVVACSLTLAFTLTSQRPPPTSLLWVARTSPAQALVTKPLGLMAAASVTPLTSPSTRRQQWQPTKLRRMLIFHHRSCGTTQAVAIQTLPLWVDRRHLTASPSTVPSKV